MKFLSLLVIAFLLTACGPAPAPAKQTEVQPNEDGCTIDSSAKMMAERKVGNIRNLQKDIFENGLTSKCTVDFDITVDGTSDHLTRTEEGLDQAEAQCYYAKNNARENLLLELGGTFHSETTTVCRRHESE